MSTTLTMPAPPEGYEVAQLMVKAARFRRPYYPHELEAAVKDFNTHTLYESDQLYALAHPPGRMKELKRCQLDVKSGTWGGWY